MTTITSERLRSLFRPRNIALVGAADKSAFSQIAYMNLAGFGFTEHTYLVNKRGAETHGRATVTSCAEIGEPVDVAYMMVPQAATLDALTDAAAAGIRNAVILSSGYGEMGAEGMQAQDELVAHAESLDMVLLGPNHLGFANFVDGVPVTSVPGLPKTSGPVALLSQSGASSSAMVDFAANSGNDLSYMVTLGNEAMITAGHVLDFLVDDEQTKAVAIFMEAVRQPEVFRRAALRAAAAGKAVVVLKNGSSELSARSAAAHTGALVGDDRVLSAMFADLGIIRVDTIEDMLITAGAAARLGRLARPGIGVVSISGGACGVVADTAAELGVSLPALAPATHDAIAAVMPAYGTVQNPLDVTGAATIDPTIFTNTVASMSEDPAVGAVAMVFALPWRAPTERAMMQGFINAIGAGIAKAAVPVVMVNQVMQPITEVTRESMAEAGVPFAITGLRQAVSALGRLAWWSDATRDAGAEPIVAAPVELPAGHRAGGTWSEVAAREVLASAGIPVAPGRLVQTADEAQAAAAEFGVPVALKIVSPQILHKSDIGGVRLGVQAGDVASAFGSVRAAGESQPGADVEGVLVSPMRTGGLELLVGVVRDPSWGPMLAVALGGIFVEVLGDSALSPLPISPARARALLSGLRAAPLFAGARGMKPVDLDRLSSVVARIGDLALALGDDLESLEVNPLWVDGDTVEALDAVVTWRGGTAT